jgi:O-antigen/teichoic acid export membrane protein
MMAIMLLAEILALHVFKVPEDLSASAVLVFRLAGIGFLGSVSLSWGRAVAMGLQRFDLSYSVSVVVSTVGTLLGLGVVFAGYGVVGYVVVRVVLSLLAGPAYWLLTRRLLPDFRFRWGLDGVMLHRVSGYVGYGTLNRMTSSLFSRLDQTLIGVWVGVAAAGIYAVPFMVVNSLGYMIAYMLGFIFPMASELQGLGQMDRLRDIFTRATKFTTALADLIFVPLFVLGDLFLALWVPGIAGQATSVLRLLALAGYVGTLTVALTNSVVVGLGRMRQFTIYANIRGLVLGAWCVLLIPRFGLEGAGWALLLTCGVDVVYLAIVLRNYLQISPAALFRMAYLKPMALGVALAALALLARPLVVSWIGLGIVGVGLSMFYVVFGYRIGVFGETEKRAVVGLWQVVTKSVRQVEGHV